MATGLTRILGSSDAITLDLSEELPQPLCKFCRFLFPEESLPQGGVQRLQSAPQRRPRVTARRLGGGVRKGDELEEVPQGHW